MKKYDELGFVAAGEVVDNYWQRRNLKIAQQSAQNAQRDAQEWEAAYQQLKQKYNSAVQEYIVEMDAMMAWREIAMEQAEEIRGKPFSPRGTAVRKAEVAPLGDRLDKILARRKAARAAGKPEKF